MIHIELWRARIGLFHNLRSRWSGDGRVKVLLELRARLSRHAKKKRPAQCEAKNEEEEAQEVAAGGGENAKVEVKEGGRGGEGQGRGVKVEEGRKGRGRETEQGGVEGVRGEGQGRHREVEEEGRRGKGQGREGGVEEGVKGGERRGQGGGVEEEGKGQGGETQQGGVEERRREEGQGQERGTKQEGGVEEGGRGQGKRAAQGGGVKGKERMGVERTDSTDWVRMFLRILTALLFHLLFVSGDVELNPGPGLGEKPQKEQFLLIEHDNDKIRIRDTVAAQWKDFATYLHLDKGNNLDAEFDRCFRDPFKMADRVIDLYLNNERDLDPPVNPSWKEVLEALRKMKQMGLVRKLEAYFSSSSDEATDPTQSTHTSQFPDYSMEYQQYHGGHPSVSLHSLEQPPSFAQFSRGIPSLPPPPSSHGLLSSEQSPFFFLSTRGIPSVPPPQHPPFSGQFFARGYSSVLPPPYSHDLYSLEQPPSFSHSTRGSFPQYTPFFLTKGYPSVPAPPSSHGLHSLEQPSSSSSSTLGTSPIPVPPLPSSHGLHSLEQLHSSSQSTPTPRFPDCSRDYQQYLGGHPSVSFHSLEQPPYTSHSERGNPSVPPPPSSRGLHSLEQTSSFSHSTRRTAPPPQPSTSSQDLSTLDQFKLFLKDIYQKKTFPTYFKQPTLKHTAQQFINLALVHREFAHHSSQEEREEVILLKLHGNVDCITRRKTELDIASVCKYEEYETQGYERVKVTKLADNILVEGAPGVGKTTFAWKLCQEWAKGRLLQEWTIVVLIQLRDQDVREAKTLHDLLYHPDPTVRNSVNQETHRVYGKGVLLILDGYDELSDSQRANGSVFQQLLRRKLLHKATLMILSRPIATRTLPWKFYSDIKQHIEILGFTKENIDSYITSACNDERELTSSLKSYLSFHPFSYSLMYNPLQCAIVTDLYCIHWQDGDKGFAPKTLTELYTDLVRTLLLRYLSSHHEYSQSDWLIRDFPDLPREVYEQFKKVAQLAAWGIEKRVYVFDEAPEEILGLMQRVEEVYPGRGKSISHSFLHLTMQEYLAAYHWSQLPAREVEHVLEKLFPLDTFLKKYGQKHYSSDTPSSCTFTHWPVLLFIAGMTKLSWNPHSLLSRGIDRSQDKAEVKPSLLHLLYETQCPRLIQSTLAPLHSSENTSSSLLHITPETALDFFVTGYCIPTSSSLWNVTVTSEHFSVLPKGLHLASIYCNGRIDTLHVGTSIYYDITERIAVLPQLHPHTQTLRVLTIRGDCSEQCAEVFQQFPSNYPLLEILNIDTKHLSSLQPLFPVLPLMTSLTTLHVEFKSYVNRQNLTQTITLFCKYLPNCSFKNLSLHSNSPIESPLPLKVSHKLECLELTSFTFTPVLTQSIPHFISSQQDNPHTLKLDRCVLSSEATSSLTHSLQSPHWRLHKLGLLKCTIPTLDLPHLTTAVSSSTTIKHLFFVIDNLDTLLVKTLASTLQQNTKMEEMVVGTGREEVGGGILTEEVLRLLVEAVDSSAVKKLRLHKCYKDWLCDCPLSRDDVDIEWCDSVYDLFNRW